MTAKPCRAIMRNSMRKTFEFFIFFLKVFLNIAVTVPCTWTLAPELSDGGQPARDLGKGRPGTHCLCMHVNFPTFREFRATNG